MYSYWLHYCFLALTFSFLHFYFFLWGDIKLTTPASSWWPWLFFFPDKIEAVWKVRLFLLTSNWLNYLHLYPVYSAFSLFAISYFSSLVSVTVVKHWPKRLGCGSGSFGFQVTVHHQEKSRQELQAGALLWGNHQRGLLRHR